MFWKSRERHARLSICQLHSCSEDILQMWLKTMKVEFFRIFFKKYVNSFTLCQATITYTIFVRVRSTPCHVSHRNETFWTGMGRVTVESMGLVIPSMAVEPSELPCSNSMDLSNNEKSQKSMMIGERTWHHIGLVHQGYKSCLERWRFSLFSVCCAGSSRR